MAFKAEFHEACFIFPPMTDAQLKELIDDMVKNGYRRHHPILKWRGQIVDGRHRYIAAGNAGIMDQVTFLNLPKDADPISVAVRANDARRHLTADQRVAAAAKAKRMYEELKIPLSRNDAGVEKKPATWRDSSRPTTNAVAEKFGVSPHSVERALRVHDENPELFKKIESGERTVRSAANEVSAAGEYEPPDEEPESLEVLDASGRHINVPALVPFINRAAYDAHIALIKEIEQVRDKVRRQSEQPAGRKIGWQRLTVDFANILSAMRWASPWTTCPWCHGDSNACKACGNELVRAAGGYKGWISKGQAEIPDTKKILG